MKYLGHLTILSLFCLPAFASYPDEINYPYYENIYRTYSRDLSNLVSRSETLDRDSRNQYSRIVNLQNTFNNYSNETLNINNRISSLSIESRNLLGQRDRLLREERDLGNQLNRARNDYDRLKREVDFETRRLEPIRSQINRVNNEVNSARSNYNLQNNRVNSARNDLSTAQNGLNRVRADISRMEGIPNRNANQQAQLDNLYRLRSSLDSEISRKTIQLSQEQTRANQLAQQISIKENELRNIQNHYNRESQRLAQLQTSLNSTQRAYTDIERRFNNTRTNLTNTERRISSISSEVMGLENRKRDIDRAQASIRMDIDSSQRVYNQQLRDLESLRRNIQNQQTLVATAQDDYKKRESLYLRYYDDAQNLGRSQVASAQSRGSVQGKADAKLKGSQLGSNLGDIIGLANGNLWGAIRAEVLGYKDGYSIGYNSPKTDAQAAADRDAQADARSYVEINLRPSYFEEVVQAEIKKPFSFTKKLEIPFSKILFNSTYEGNLEVSENEIADSERLRTPYDGTIDRFNKEKRVGEEKLAIAQNAINSYAHQESYPYDKVNCSNVYKGVTDFIATCEESFRSYYSGVFENAAYETYRQHFSDYFSASFDQTYAEVLEVQYTASYNKAYDASKNFGTSEGKRVMYEEAYAIQYKISYTNHLETQKTRARADVVTEFAAFLNNRALLTMVGLESSEEIVAGETITVSALLRNLGKSKAGMAHLNILNVRGAQIVTKMVSTPEVGPRSQAKMIGPKVRVLPELVTGNTFTVEVEATLPGDNYKSSRVEKLTLEKRVSVNPAQTLNLNVDYSPAIRSVLRKFLIHTLSVDASAKFEDLKTDLDVRVVSRSGSEHIDFKVTEQKLLKMKKGEKKNLKFSYVFKDSANGKNIELAIEFLYKGRVVQTQDIVLKPH